MAKKKESFTKIPNELLRDNNLSPEARFLMSYILSLPRTWDFSIRGLAKAINVTVPVVTRAFKELEKNDYVIKFRVSGGRGKCGWAYVFSTTHFTSVENIEMENTSIDFFDFVNSSAILDYNRNKDYKEERLNKIKDYILAHYVPKSPVSDLKKPIQERKKDFIERLSPFLEQYGRDMLNKFYAYWTEISPRGKKMKFEKQDTFEISKRLATWKSNDETNFGRNTQATKEKQMNVGTNIPIRDGSQFKGNPDDFLKTHKD